MSQDVLEVMSSALVEETDHHTIERRFRTPRDSRDIEGTLATLSEEIEDTTIETYAFTLCDS
jgi:hypothetical protein